MLCQLSYAPGKIGFRSPTARITHNDRQYPSSVGKWYDLLRRTADECVVIMYVAISIMEIERLPADPHNAVAVRLTISQNTFAFAIAP